jgi:adenosylmethionine-8-amino-7-oxononanoate transaminase/dethiobiotin synthase
MPLIILGTDTDAGKTTFSLLWLAAHPDYAYWKPVETGDSDSMRVRALVPGAKVFDPVARFRDPVAPPLAAEREGKAVPSAVEIGARRPAHSHLLIETFGGPFSPLDESELQIELTLQLGGDLILVGSSALGAVGRTLAMLEALAVHSIRPAAVVLIGDDDEYARKQIENHSGIPAFALRPPATFDAAGIQTAAREQIGVLQSVRSRIAEPGAPARVFARAAGSEEWMDADRRTVWHPYTSLRDPDPPLPVVAAEREFLHLADGRRIIDGISSWWTILHGHREPRLMAALREASRSFDHVLFAGVTHAPAIRVAELLLQTAPWLGGRVFFSDDGSTAVEVALKMAYQVWRQRGEPQRTLFVGFEHGYHGDTFGAMAVGRDPLFTGNFEPLLIRAERAPVSAERLDDLLNRKGQQVAAVISEPLVQGAGGMKMHSPEELRAIFEVTRRHGVLFIADEVMTGCHRTGTFWAFQAAGIAPDLICTAKTLAGGVLPLAATLASPEIVDDFDTADRERTFFHGHSFTAHPLACAVAAANLEWLLREPPTAPARFEKFWTEALGPLRDHPEVNEVRVRGTIAAVEFDMPGGYLAEAGREMRRRCLEHGVFLRPLGNVLYALPPFGTSNESLRRVGEAMKDCVSASTTYP